MTSKGITAFMVVVAMTIGISIMSGIGAYAALGVDYQATGNDDVQAAADSLIGQEASDQAAGSALEDFTTNAARVLSSAWQVIANLSGILQLLFGLPAALTDPLEKFFQITYGITFAAFLRGVILQ